MTLSPIDPSEISDYDPRGLIGQLMVFVPDIKKHDLIFSFSGNVVHVLDEKYRPVFKIEHPYVSVNAVGTLEERYIEVKEKIQNGLNRIKSREKVPYIA